MSTLTPTYHAAKFAVEGLMEALSYELSPFHIDCKLIEPGGIETDFWNRSYVMTNGVEESVYAPQASAYLNGMTDTSKKRATPDMVAEVIYTAATDGKHQWRYTVACEEFIAYRKSMTDDEWYASICTQYNQNK